jgi:hypothetical protein
MDVAGVEDEAPACINNDTWQSKRGDDIADGAAIQNQDSAVAHGSGVEHLAGGDHTGLTHQDFKAHSKRRYAEQKG